MTKDFQKRLLNRLHRSILEVGTNFWNRAWNEPSRKKLSKKWEERSRLKVRKKKAQLL